MGSRSLRFHVGSRSLRIPCGFHLRFQRGLLLLVFGLATVVSRAKGGEPPPAGPTSHRSSNSLTFRRRTYYLLLTTYYLLLTTYYSLLTTDYLLLTTHYLLLTTHYSLLTTHYLLPSRIARSTCLMSAMKLSNSALESSSSCDGIMRIRTW